MRIVVAAFMLVVASVRVNHLYIGLEKISDPKRGAREGSL